MVVHKRTEQWGSLPFRTLGEAAEFIADLEPKLTSMDGARTSVTVSTEERDFRELTLDELRELSETLSMDDMQAFTAFCGRDGERCVCVKLALLNDRKVATRLDVEGEEEVVVDGLYVVARRRIEGCFEKILRVESGAEVEGEVRGKGNVSSGRRLERWMIQILGGAAAAVLAAGIIFLLSH
jgi:hypothetical protein